jgi:excisionase family DNA binding protein
MTVEQLQELVHHLLERVEALEGSAPTDLLTITEAAKRLKVSRNSVYRLVRSGDLPVVQVGAHSRIPADALRWDFWK